jgi:hypothetical protein
MLDLFFHDPQWTDAQREFLRSLTAAGATKADHAVPIDRASPLPARELQVLVDSGFVREATGNGYYVYQRQRETAPTVGDSDDDEAEWAEYEKHVAEGTVSRGDVKMVVLILVLFLTPLVLLAVVFS